MRMMMLATGTHLLSKMICSHCYHYLDRGQDPSCCGHSEVFNIGEFEHCFLLGYLHIQLECHSVRIEEFGDLNVSCGTFRRALVTFLAIPADWTMISVLMASFDFRFVGRLVLSRRLYLTSASCQISKHIVISSMSFSIQLRNLRCAKSFPRYVLTVNS